MSAIVTMKWRYRKVHTWRLFAGWRIVPFSACLKMRPSRHVHRKKHRKVPNNQVKAALPTGQLLSRPWWAPGGLEHLQLNEIQKEQIGWLTFVDEQNNRAPARKQYIESKREQGGNTRHTIPRAPPSSTSSGLAGRPRRPAKTDQTYLGPACLKSNYKTPCRYRWDAPRLPLYCGWQLPIFSCDREERSTKLT